MACHEWQDAVSREQTAAAAEAEGDAALADALRTKDSSKLRKAQFIWLCRHWGYASPYWRPKREPGGLARKPSQSVVEA